MECFYVKLTYSIRIFGNEILRCTFSLESQRSSLDGFSKIAIMKRFPWNHWDHLLMDFPKELLCMESLQIIEKISSGLLANFLAMA